VLADDLGLALHNRRREVCAGGLVVGYGDVVAARRHRGGQDGSELVDPALVERVDKKSVGGRAAAGGGKRDLDAAGVGGQRETELVESGRAEIASLHDEDAALRDVGGVAARIENGRDGGRGSSTAATGRSNGAGAGEAEGQTRN